MTFFINGSISIAEDVPSEEQKRKVVDVLSDYYTGGNYGFYIEDQHWVLRFSDTRIHCYPEKFFETALESLRNVGLVPMVKSIVTYYGENDGAQILLEDGRIGELDQHALEIWKADAEELKEALEAKGFLVSRAGDLCHFCDEDLWAELAKRHRSRSGDMLPNEIGWPIKVLPDDIFDVVKCYLLMETHEQGGGVIMPDRVYNQLDPITQNWIRQEGQCTDAVLLEDPTTMLSVVEAVDDYAPDALAASLYDEGNHSADEPRCFDQAEPGYCKGRESSACERCQYLHPQILNL